MEQKKGRRIESEEEEEEGTQHAVEEGLRGGGVEPAVDGSVSRDALFTLFGPLLFSSTSG